MDLDRFQGEARRLTRGLEHPRVGAALALGEECGEILRWVLEHEVYASEAPSTPWPARSATCWSRWPSSATATGSRSPTCGETRVLAKLERQGPRAGAPSWATASARRASVSTDSGRIAIRRTGETDERYVGSWIHPRIRVRRGSVGVGAPVRAQSRGIVTIGSSRASSVDTVTPTFEKA